MSDLVFDTPWWLLIAIGVVGVALLVSGNARQNRKMTRGGLLVLLLGVLLAITSYLVDTPREAVIKHTHEVVKAVVDRDTAKLSANLLPNATLGQWNRREIVDGAISLANRFGLKEATITGTDVAVQSQVITVRIRVVSNFQSPEIAYQTTPTDWELIWRPSGDGKWMLQQITPLGGGEVSGEQMNKLFFQ